MRLPLSLVSRLALQGFERNDDPCTNLLERVSRGMRELNRDIRQYMRTGEWPSVWPPPWRQVSSR
jgi:hypothetical protein